MLNHRYYTLFIPCYLVKEICNSGDISSRLNKKSPKVLKTFGENFE